MIRIETCPDCEGRGTIDITEEIKSSVILESTVDCEYCEGLGTVEYGEEDHDEGWPESLYNETAEHEPDEEWADHDNN